MNATSSLQMANIPTCSANDDGYCSISHAGHRGPMQLLFTFSSHQIFYIPSDIFTSHHHIFLHKTKPISN